jgi:hypothetical protein
MNAPAKIEAAGLDKLRQPFPAHHISKLPKETKAQIEARRADKSLMVWKCPDCGGPHHKNAVHLDYVGHAALTDRLLDTDPAWFWEPAALDANGLPAFDKNGGLWIKLTVLGVTRLGYGAADGKAGGDAVKEIIGDALRNAAMRFGAALDLWHKGDLHADEGDGEPAPNSAPRGIDAKQCAELRRLLKEADTSEDAFVDWLKCGTLPELPVGHFDRARNALQKRIKGMRAERSEKAVAGSDILDDEIPY